MRPWLTVALVALCAVTPAWAQWTTPINISLTNGMFSGEASYAFDADGNIHCLFYDFLDSNYGIYYTNNVGGTWTKSVFQWGAKYPILVITPDNVIHAFYLLNGIWEVTKPAIGGSWSSPVRAAENPSSGFPWDAIVDSTGGIYLLWYNLFDASMSPNRSALWGRYKPFGGSWGSTELIKGTNDENKWPMDGRIAHYNGKFYCSWKYDDNVRYRVRETNGTWGPEKSIPYPGTIGSIAFSPTGEMAVAYARNIAQEGLDYEVYVITSQDQGNTWSSEFCVSNSNWLSRAPMDVVYDQNSNLHITWQRNDYDGEDFDMWYRCRIGGVWQAAQNITNNGTRTGARFSHALQARGANLHFMYADTAGLGGYEDVFYMMKPGSSDTTPPGPVTSFVATAGENRIELSWHNPSDPDYIATMVRYSTTGYPTGPFNGNLACLRTASPGSNDAFTLYPLTPGVRYYFTAYAQDSAGNWSTGVTSTAVPVVDVTPPANVTSFTATPYTARNIQLSWTNPSDIDYKGTMVRFKTTGFPTGPSDGTLLCTRAASPGSSDSYLHDEITPGITYYYRAFSYDAEPNYASGVTASGVPIEPTCDYIKKLPDNTDVELRGAVVSAIFTADSVIYVQDVNRCSGIRVAHNGAGLTIGQRVDVTGKITTRTSSGYPLERMISNATVSNPVSGAAPKPLAMNCKAVGGGPIPPYVPGVKDGVGLNNIGLLVKIAGKVTKVIGNYIYVDDGSKIANVSGSGSEIGVMFKCWSTPTVSVGNIVSCTGIVEGSIPSGWTENRRYIRARSDADLRLISINKGTIAGTVRDNANNPISGATVSTSTGGYTASTNSSGAYTISNVTPGTYDVTASKTGFASQTQSSIQVRADQTSTVNFTLSPTTGSIAGTVKDHVGAAISGATVSTTTGGYTTTTNSSGAYTLSAVAPGTYNVTASKTGYSPQTVTGVNVTVGNTSTANFTLSPTTGTIAGTVKDSGGVAISGATVSTTTGGYTTTTNSTGAYTLSAVAPGTYSVTASKAGYYSQTQTGVTVTVGNTTTANFTLAAQPGSITGTVKDNLGAAISGATVSTTTGGYSTTTNSSGAYTLSNVTAGTYSVTASKTNYYSHTNTGVVVPMGGTVTSNFTLQPQPGCISGTVKNTSGSGLSGAVVSTTTGGYSTTTNASGGYTICNVAVGTYSVTASADGYSQATNTGVTVYSNQTTTSNFTLNVAVEKLAYGDMEGGFFSTGWGSNCSGKSSKLPGPSSAYWGWNNDSSYPFNTWDSTSVKHAGSHSLGFTFCQTAADPGKLGIASQSVNLGPGGTALFSAWGYHTNGNCPSIMCWNPGQGQNNPYTAQSAGRFQWICTDSWSQVNTWVTRSMTVTADSSGYVTIMVGGAAWTGTPSGTVVYIDDVSVKQ